MMGNTALTSNIVEQILCFGLLDDLFGIVEDGQRFDGVSFFENMLEGKRKEEDRNRDRWFPDLPNRRLPLGLPLGDYAGRYWHPGYKNFTLKLIEKEDGEAVLHLAIHDRVWSRDFDFEHVSGEFFLMGLGKVEFRLGADGRVKKMGITIEPAMGEEMIWWERVDY